MTTQLIPIFSGAIANESALLCNARDLHKFLNVGKVFAAWITSRIAEYGFVENQDYILLSRTGKQTSGRGGHNRKDYHLTLDTAKELAMVERNEKGHQIRRYFIECERKLHTKSKIRQCTTKQLTPLRQTAERLITTGLGKIYPDIWKLVHQRFDVEHIHQLQPEQVGEAIEYLNVLEGEYLGRETLPATPSVHFTNEELCALCWVWNAAEYMREKLELAYPAMRTLKSEYAPSFYSMAFEYQRTLEAGRKVLERETKHIVPHPHSVSDENWRRVLPRLRQNSLPKL